MKILYEYKYSVIITIFSIIILFLIYGLSFFTKLLITINSTNLFFFILLGFSNYLAVFSFFPLYYILTDPKKRKKLIKFLFTYEYKNSTGNYGESYLTLKLNIKKSLISKIRTMDLFFLLITIPIFILFIKIEALRLFLFLLLPFQILFIAYKIIRNNTLKSKSILYLLFNDSFFRYFLEFPKALLAFYSINLFPGIPIILSFIGGSSLLYFFPKIKNGIGLLEIYSILFLTAMGNTPLQGFYLAVLLRLSAIIFYILPFHFIKKLKERIL